eukprot:6174165-Pleurochrysis_carterae.AAC.1
MPAAGNAAGAFREVRSAAHGAVWALCRAHCVEEDALAARCMFRPARTAHRFARAHETVCTRRDTAERHSDFQSRYSLTNRLSKQNLVVIATLQSYK